VAEIVVEVVRAGVVEARHTVHAVAVEDGRIVESAGDPHLVTYFRSSAKPIQVLPLVRARPDLDDREIAIACASHLHRTDQLAAVLSLLAKARMDEDDLECGPEPTRLQHTCSGKHAGMLLLCRERGWTADGYHLPEHPCQEAMRAAFSRLAVLDGGTRTARAMKAHPELIEGPGGVDTELMLVGDGWLAKYGAEGLVCAARGGIGVAVKAEDGAKRALRPAVAAFLARLGFGTGELGDVLVRNSLGDVVGELRAR
jgi:L-asparaginase